MTQELRGDANRLYNIMLAFEEKKEKPKPKVNSIRCQSISPTGTQCGLPNNHSGNHQNGIAVKSWS